MFHFLMAAPWAARRHARPLACAALLWLAANDPAPAQAGAQPPTASPSADLAEPAQQPLPQAQPAPEQSAPAFAPGLIDKLGDLIKGSVDSVSSNLKGT